MKKEPIMIGKKTFFDPSIISGLFLSIIGIVVFITSDTYRTIGLIVFIVGILFGILMAVVLDKYKVELYEDVLIIKSGLIAKREEEISIKNIASVKLNKSGLGRILGFGDITLDIVGKSPILIPGIDKAELLSDSLRGRLSK